MKRRVTLIIVAVVLLTVTIVVFNFARAFILRPASNTSAYRLETVVSGLASPVYLAHAGDGSGRLFIVEQGGLIRILKDGAILDRPFLDVTALLNKDGLERGLLSMAFHPQYAQNGRFFIYYTAVDGKNTVASYQVTADDPEQADPNSAAIILALDDPYPNHNAGQLAFGPDGYLYIGTGDGGSAGDPHGNGQNGRALLGKILRIDVDSSDPYSIPPDNPFVDNPDFAPELWAYGIRNPWRYSFDRQTGDLYIADVGQNNWEEINYQRADSAGGENYGWNIMEGDHPYSGAPIPNGLTNPVAEYSHSDGCSVTGGYVYRGELLPDLRGAYIFGDWCSGTVWTIRQDGAGNWAMNGLLNSGKLISSFGEDESGELYLVDHGGSVLQFIPQN
jgi:glucose/arabinose dehydrogenase